MSEKVDPVPYTVRAATVGEGVEDFNFESLSDALEGLGTVALVHNKLKDGKERWYRVIPTPPPPSEEEERAVYDLIAELRTDSEGE